MYWLNKWMLYQRTSITKKAMVLEVCIYITINIYSDDKALAYATR